MNVPTSHQFDPQWYSALPEGWEDMRLGSLLEQVDERASNERPILSVSIHRGVSDRELADEDMERTVVRSEDRSKYKSVEPGDLVYNMMRAWQGGFGTVTVPGAISPAYVVARPKDADRVSARFLELMLRTPAAIEELRRCSYGITDFRLRLYWDSFKNIRVPIPPPNEQQIIAAYLDRETGRIDALVERLKRLIALLAEKRQAVISQAVTKGLNPDAPMKDSGIDWLGEVPAHWQVKPSKYVFKNLDARRIPVSAEERSSMQGAYPYYGASGIIDSVNDYLFDERTILVGEDGANLLMKSTPIAFIADGKYWVNNHAHILRPYVGDFTFLAEALNQTPFELFTTGSAQPKLTSEALGNIPIAVAPPHEQMAIGRTIEAGAAQFSDRLKLIKKQVQTAKERRSALISAAVTGQIPLAKMTEEGPRP